MNCFLHGIEDFRIERGDTLSEPKLVQGDRLMRFDVVLANPPYSIKQWHRDAFASDPWGRNRFGTPPQGRADYAFWQHILHSLAPKTGRCAILFPHGVLFRQEEADMRRKLIEAGLIECVLGLGPNLFYNSPMEACIIICRTAKAKERRHKILFINAVNEVTRERAQSFLTDEHIGRIVKAYKVFKDEPGFTRVVGLEEIRAGDGNLSIPLYVSMPDTNGPMQVSVNGSLPEALSAWLSSASNVHAALATILGTDAIKETRSLDGKPATALPAWIKRDAWQRLPFGAFAQNVNERVEPSQAGDAIYVGLEHLDPQDLHIRRWGKGSDVIGTKLRFRKGDLIFGRRRAYQRKLAVAEFDGICSAHAMVVRARSDVVLPEFLPFLMISDRFMNRAVEISVGSLSPTINWTTLKLEEFALPPLAQQRRIAEILWAVDEVGQQQAAVVEYTAQLPLSFANHVTVLEGSELSNFRESSLGDVADVIDCKHRTPRFADEGIAVISPGNIKWGPLDLTGCKKTSESEYSDLMDHCSVREWDLVMGRNQTFGIASFVQPNQKFVLGQDTVLIQPRELNSKYVYLALQSSFVRSQIDRLSVGSTFKRVNLRDIRSLQIPRASVVMQHKAEQVVRQHLALVEAIQANQTAFRTMLVRLLNATFAED
jgi:type I restriction enzyme M protein